MAAASARASIEGMLKLIKKSKWPLAPVYEAIANSLEAIAERQKGSQKKAPGKVEIRFHFRGLIADTRSLDRIEIADNGIGFDAENYGRFEVFLDRSKGFNNRGSGRVQFLHLAGRIDVQSCYRVGDAIKRRRFTCTPSAFITSQEETPAPEDAKLGSTVTLREFEKRSDGTTQFDALTLDELEGAVKRHFLLRLHLARARDKATAPVFTFVLLKNDKVIASRVLSARDLPEPETGTIQVPIHRIKDAGAEKVEWQKVPARSEKLKWAHFKLPASELVENGVFMCSKGVTVQQVRFDELKKHETVGGHHFLTAIHADMLDRADNVSDAVDEFTLPTRADAERSLRDGALFFNPDQDIVFFDDIESAVGKALPGIYKDLLDQKAAQEKDVEAIAKAHGIPLDMVEDANIGLSDNEATITDKLFKTQAVAHAKRSLKIKKLFEQLETLDPSSETYQRDLEQRSHELLQLIPEQNKQELSRYVIRRQMVAKVLGMIVDDKLAPPQTDGAEKGRADREGLIHDLIFKRKSPTADGPNDLWILNEEFVHFEGCSELPIDQIVDARGEKILGPISDEDLERYGVKHKKRRRPDIFLFADEGQCVLIELKAPDVELSEHLTQLHRYCNVIANFAQKPITRFHCYLIGETVSEMDVSGFYLQNMHGDWIARSPYKVMGFQKGRQNTELGEAHVEIIKLSSIYDRAIRRNASFAHQLGIDDGTLQQAT